ncbi:helix-turn-helix domain-containing protein [Mycetocola zhadangensis]|uniref:AraC family transcriptional regulator n=1 Tax=Mycetocola zhadangensis TaxID=1164595 RepID=A0A3L7IT54_9MICO|nr:helix-turn-helix domain-containing protein [Mycetocola zhadangensis]RLQ81438.1 AraC family transcriptional regulator [Mycetocola zhadangensis]GGF01640.1 AraC family transcriptional regulator [Mycetocola zhadangensis]
MDLTELVPVRTVQSAQATPVLRPFVRAFAQRTATGLFDAQPMPAFLETVIHFEFADRLNVRSPSGGYEQVRPLELVGPHTHGGTSLLFEGTVNSFAIFLQPVAAWSLFRLLPSAVAERHHDAADVLGKPVVSLWHILAENPDFTDRVRAAETFLLSYLESQHSDTTSTTAASLLSLEEGRIGVADLASRMHLSVRQLERGFLREIGVPPKRFARVARFQGALDARVECPDRSWLKIAIDSGYHDQMHLVHDFHSLAGFTPELTLEMLGDSRPSALAVSHHPVTS